jgi:tetratricopeptide (TPR) repeat protein
MKTGTPGGSPSDAVTETLRRVSGLLQAGRYVDAHSQLESLVTEHPDTVEALRLLAGTKQILGDVARAETLLRHALDIAPRWTPTLTTLAELLLAAGRGAEAVPLLQRAVEGVPPAPRAAWLLMRHHLDSGQPAAALETATLWSRRARLDADMAALHVTAHAALGRAAEAVAHYRGVVAAAPGDVAAVHALALALNAADEPAEAERILRPAMGRTRPTAAMHYTHARSLLALEQFEPAEQALRAVLGLAPRHAEAHDRLAQLVYMRTGNIVDATRGLDQALEQFEHDDALWATKAALLQAAGDARGAYACLADRAQRAQAPPALVIRAGLAALDFEPAHALALAQRALAALPRDLTARKLFCSACLGVGDGGRALEEAARLLEAAPDDQYLIAMQATALRLLHDPRYEALCDYDAMLLTQMLDTPPGWPDLDRFLAELASRLDTLHNPHGHRLLYQSLRGGTETTQDLSRSTDPVIQALFQAFAAPIARYRRHIGEGQDPLRRRNRGASRFNGSWSVRLRHAGFHTSHVHPRGWISSACYIQLPSSMRGSRTDEGILSFGAPGMLTSPTLPAELSVRPVAGQLVLFPSYVWHGTLPFQGDQPRLTVAFDVVPG